MEKRSLKDRLHLKKLSMLASIPEAVMVCNALVVQAADTESSGASITTKVKNSSLSAYEVIKAACLALVVVVLAVIGGIMIIGTQKMKEAVKENLYWIAFGLMIIFTAREITSWVETTFGS